MKTTDPHYHAYHSRVYAARGPAKLQTCEDCEQPAEEWAMLHDRSGASPDDYKPLCRKCHHKYDRPLRPRLSFNRGEDNQSAKLTDDKVREIWALREQGLSNAAIARMYGVGPTAIWGIFAGRRWTHVR